MMKKKRFSLAREKKRYSTPHEFRLTHRPQLFRLYFSLRRQVLNTYQGVRVRSFLEIAFDKPYTTHFPRGGMGSGSCFFCIISYFTKVFNSQFLFILPMKLQDLVRQCSVGRGIRGVRMRARIPRGGGGGGNPCQIQCVVVSKAKTVLLKPLRET